MNYPKEVNIIELENAPFRNSEDADAWARSHGVIGLMSNVDTDGKGEVSISARSIDKMLSGAALKKSVTPDSYEINNIEVLKGTAESVIQPNDKTPMIDTDVLLNGVCDVNGVPLLKN